VLSEDRLEAAFLAEVPPEDRPRFGPRLKADLSAAWTRGRERFAEIPLDDETFARQLARAMKRRGDGTALSALAAEDLYLAYACFVGAPGAVRALIEQQGPVIRRAIERTVPKPNAAEVEQELLADLLVGTPARPPEIGAYAGRAPLARWVAVIAQRAGLRWLRVERAQTTVAVQAGLEPRLAGDTPIEDALCRERYLDEFERSLKEALGRAPEQDRALLRLHMVDNLTVEKIARMRGISQPTASRWLAKAREGVLADLKSMLKARLKMDTVDVDHLADLLASRLDLSISRLLRTA
jgi:RNA polymerase sigma-70 factor, ECF subfamily